MSERTLESLVLDAVEQLQTISVQQATIQGSINILVTQHARAEEDRREIKEQVTTINGRIRALESVRDQMAGAAGAVKFMWMALAAFIGFAASWAAKKLGF